MENILKKKSQIQKKIKKELIKKKNLTGFYSPFDVNYVVELNLDKNELNQRNNAMKFNLKTLQNISPRDIELIKKPKVPKKEIL